MNNHKKEMSRREFVKIMAAGAAGTVALSVGGASLFAATPRRGGILKCGMSFLIQSPDPHRRIGPWARQDSALVYEGLVDPVSMGERIQALKENGKGAIQEVRPMLADAWDIEKGGTRYVFHLKKGVKFHDGKEFGSEDVKWNWERVKDPNSLAGARRLMAIYIKSIETPDRYTVVANLTQPNAAFLIGNAWVNTCILPKDSIPKGKIFGEGGYSSDRAAPPGTGPFEMVKFKQNDKAVFKAHKEYRIPGLPYLDGVEMLVIKDQPRTMALRAGDVDYIYGVIDEYFATVYNEQPLYQPFEKDNLTFYPRLNDNTMTLFLNNHPIKGHSPFEDERIRKAFALSIDRRKLAQALYGKRGIPTVQGFQPSESYWGFDDIKVPEPDIAKARQLLKEAGHPNGVDVDLYITPTMAKNDQMAQIVQQMAAAAGFRIKIVSQMGLQYWGHLSKMDVDIITFYIGGDDPMSYYDFFLHTDKASKNNGRAPVTGIKDPVMDKLLDEMAAEMNMQKRRAIFKKVVLRAEDKAYFFTYLQMVLANAWTKKLQNFTPSNYYIPEQGFREAWLES